jgi:hypothetical protein
MINETDLDTVISELRVELDRVDRAIQVFERLASSKKAARRKRTGTGSGRLKRPPEESLSSQSATNPY